MITTITTIIEIIIVILAFVLTFVLLITFGVWAWINSVQERRAKYKNLYTNLEKAMRWLGFGLVALLFICIINNHFSVF